MILLLYSALRPPQTEKSPRGHLRSFFECGMDLGTWRLAESTYGKGRDPEHWSLEFSLRKEGADPVSFVCTSD